MNALNFIIIDDDHLNNYLNKICIKALTKNRSEVQTFTDAEVGLSYIISEFMNTSRIGKTVLLLDINMPLWSGWYFLDAFEQLDAHIKQQIKIYIVSNSFNVKEIERANANKNVAAHFIKPLPEKIIKSILNEDGRQTWPVNPQ